MGDELNRNQGGPISRSFWNIIGAVLLLVLSAGFAEIQGQAIQDRRVADTDIRVFTASGSISTEAHGYTTTRDVSRRAPLGNVTTANTNFSVLGFRSGLSFRYSTDDSRLRQSMNQVAFNGSWRWVRLAAGDVSPSWSRYSLSGTRIRGGQLQLTPGAWTLELTGGRAARAIGPREDEPVRRLSFERMLYGARVGVGRTSGSYFMLSGFYARDDKDSITLPGEFSSTGDPGDNGTDGFEGTGSPPDRRVGQTRRNFTPPAENLLISPEFQVNMFNRAFQIGGQGSVSAFTRDLRSERIDLDEADIPEFAGRILPMNIYSSTRLGYAGGAHAGLNVDPVTLRLEYERIQPGFETLGVRSLRDDRQRYSASLGLSLLDRRVQLDNSIGFDEDNLLGQRIQTQQGLDYSVNVTGRVSERLTLTAGYGINTSETSGTDPEVATGSSEYTSQNFRLQPMLTLMGNDRTHSITLATFYQTFESVSRFEDQVRRADGNTLNGMISYSVMMFGGFRINTGLNGLVGEAAGSDVRNYGLTLGTGYTFFDGRLNTNLNVGGSRNEVSREATAGQNGVGEMPAMRNVSWQMNGNMRASYRLFDAASLQLSVRANNNTITQGAGSGFSELESRLSFSYRF
jgi:hypothetical protein